MRIAIVLTPPSDLHFRQAAQIGVTDFVCRYPAHYGLEPAAGLELMKTRAESFGLRLSVVEGYLPIDRILLGAGGREAQIEEIRRLIGQMGRLGVEVLCYNFMHADWTRTDMRVPTRGGALTSGFDLDRVTAPELPPDRRVSDPERLWDNLGHFLRAIVPAAEAAGVKLALHPDDPPIPALAGGAQILFAPEAFERLFALVPSEVNGACFCQGTFSEMRVEIPSTIRRLGRRIHYAHFRDVRGGPERFVETFHDDGQTNMVRAMRAYREIGFRGPIRPDHVPKLDGEPGDGSGYSMLGRLFAVGYMRGLMQAVDEMLPASGART